MKRPFLPLERIALDWKRLRFQERVNLLVKKERGMFSQVEHALANLFTAKSGVAALEFAIVAPALLMILGGLTDFGLALNDSMQIQQAAQAGASYAFAAQQEAGVSSQISASAVKAAVQASLTLSPAPTVTVTDPEAECTQTNGTATTLTSGTYGQNCPNNNPVGTYMVITVAYTFQPLLPFYSKLSNTNLTATSTVRLY